MERGSSAAATAPTISTLSARSVAALGEAISHSEASECSILKVTLEDELGRLRVWASNLGALQPSGSPKSLDHRLRDGPLMRKSVTAGLERVLSSVKRASAILDGTAPNRSASPMSGGDNATATTELDELILSVHSAIGHLFGLSMLIRRQRPKGRLPILDNFTPSESSPDISNVTDKFPKARSTLWLAKRLGNEVTRRREIIRYRQHHRESLANKDNKRSAHAGRSDTATLATTFQEAESSGAASQVQQEAVSSRMSVFTSGTSYLSQDDGEGMGRRIPDLPDMTLDGVQLQYDEPFECPYCRTIQEVKNRLEWKRHVMSDLQPYVCTFQDCTTSARLFSSRAEWFQHEFTVHRLQWVCNWCDGPETTFSTAEGLKGHLSNVHAGTITEDQMPVILEACERPTKTFGPSSCPLCAEWEPVPAQNNAKGFGRHLARHLQQLALEALPLAIDGLEVKNAEGASEGEGSVSGESSDDEAPPDQPEEAKHDPAKEKLEAELAALKLEQAKKEEEEERRRFEEELRRKKEEEYKIREEERRKAVEEARREFEQAKAEAERQAREKLAAEQKSEAERAKLHADMMARIEREAREKYAAEVKAAEERMKREAEARAEAEATLRREFEEAKKAAEEARKAAEEEKKAHQAAVAEAQRKAGEEATAAYEADLKSKADKSVVHFKDAVGRKFAFPFNICRRWDDMRDLINQAFDHVEDIGTRVRLGQYDLIGPDGQIIVPQIWERVIEPEWSIEMKMWPESERQAMPSFSGHGGKDPGPHPINPMAGK